MKNERSYVSASADLIYVLCVRHHKKGMAVEERYD